MKKIPKTFRHWGSNYTLLKRQGMVCIYKQQSGGVTVAFEVHLIRHQKPSTAKYKQPDGKVDLVHYEAKEKLAGDNDFGTHAWSYPDLKTAMKSYEALIHD